MSAAESPLLRLDSVHFSYRQAPVLDGLSLQIAAGELVGYLGVNGSGKTTTFLLATGLLPPQAGSVETLGVDPRTSKSWCSQVGVVSYGAGHYPRLTVRQNLQFFARLYGVRPDLDLHLGAHGLSSYADHPAGQLSQGFRQRLSLARATLHRPRLLLLDEPSDGLDPAATEELHHSLRRFTSEGGAVLLTSHRLEEVEALCARVILLSEGKAAWEGSPGELEAGRSGALRRKLLGLGQERTPAERYSQTKL